MFLKGACCARPQADSGVVTENGCGGGRVGFGWRRGRVS